MLKALLKAGAKVSARDNDGDTPIHYASAQGNVDCMRALAAAPGCDLEATDNDGESPMDVAARRGAQRELQRCVAHAAHAQRASMSRIVAARLTVCVCVASVQRARAHGAARAHG